MISLSSCGGDSRVFITYGTYLPLTEVDGYKGDKISSMEQLRTMMENKESFVLTVIPTNKSCSCWSNFRDYILNRFITEAHVCNYAIDATEIKYAENKYGFTYSDAHPILYFVNGNTSKTTINFTDGSSSPFVSYTSFIDAFEKYCAYPNIYKVDETYLNENLSSQEDQVLYFYRATCGDCSDCTPHAIIPYVTSHNLTDKIWAIDLDPIRGGESTPLPGYQEFKDRWTLSENEESLVKFGYGDGVVPTLQYYESGVLKDMNVYFNDEISLINNEYIITNSYFSEERKPFLSYLDDNDEILTGKKLSSDEIIDYEMGGNHYYSWKKEYSRKFYVKYTNKFLNKYVK